MKLGRYRPYSNILKFIPTRCIEGKGFPFFRKSVSFEYGIALRSLLTPFEFAPPARAVIGNNGLQEVQKSALVEGFALADLNRSRCQVALSLVDNALGIGHDGVVDENVEMILRSEQRADVAIQRKIGPIGALDGLGHVRVGGMHQISHLAANILLPAR